MAALRKKIIQSVAHICGPHIGQGPKVAPTLPGVIQQHLTILNFSMGIKILQYYRGPPYYGRCPKYMERHLVIIKLVLFSKEGVQVGRMAGWGMKEVRLNQT